jgi:gliding motility-associated peptidyl-prolyl isomerase
MKFLNFILVGLTLCCSISCEEQLPVKPVEPNWSQEQSTKLNKRFTEEEEIKIKLYLKQRPEWEMNKSGTGLRYWIYEDLEGEIAKEGDQVDVEFEVQKLDGELIYKTEEGEFSSFKVDKSDVETGVMEGVKYMSEGDQAKFIIPSHIGHGLLGDMNKIPPLQVLVVDLKLVKIY